MKRANTKEKIKRFTEEVCRSADLVEEIGLASMCQPTVSLLSNFSEELQEEYAMSKDREKFLQKLRKSVKDEVVKIIKAKKISTIVLVKYYFIFTAPEIKSLISDKASRNENIEKLLIISEIENLLENTVGTDDEDRRVASAVNKIYKSIK